MTHHTRISSRVVVDHRGEEGGDSLAYLRYRESVDAPRRGSDHLIHLISKTSTTISWNGLAEKVYVSLFAGENALDTLNSMADRVLL